MAHRLGNKAKVYLHDHDLTGDSNGITLNVSAEAPDDTAFGDAARARVVGGLRDWSVDHSGFWGDTSIAGSDLDKVLYDHLAGSALLGVYPYTTASGRIGYEGFTLETTYSLGNPMDGVVTLSATHTGGSGLYRMASLTDEGISSEGSWTGCPVDFGGSTPNPIYGVVRVALHSAGSYLKAVIRDGSSTTATFSDCITFTALSGSGAEFKTSSGCARRYLRPKAVARGTSAGWTKFLLSAGHSACTV